MEVDLIRLSLKKELPQMGVLYFAEYPSVLTLEPPDLDNQPNISCIPEGSYVCSRRKSQKTKGLDTFEVMGVPNRTGILFHWGNSVRDTEGCILTGSEFSEDMGKPIVLRSRVAFERFMAYLRNVQSFTLYVRGLDGL